MNAKMWWANREISTTMEASKRRDKENKKKTAASTQRKIKMSSRITNHGEGIRNWGTTEGKYASQRTKNARAKCPRPSHWRGHPQGFPFPVTIGRCPIPCSLEPAGCAKTDEPGTFLRWSSCSAGGKRGFRNLHGPPYPAACQRMESKNSRESAMRSITSPPKPLFTGFPVNLDF